MDHHEPVSGVVDERDRLVSADPPLLALQRACGGDVGTTIAIPQLLALIVQARSLGLRVARQFSAFDGASTVSGWAEITPGPSEADTGDGARIVISNWNVASTEQTDEQEENALVREIERGIAECAMRLDAEQRVLSFEVDAVDLIELAASRETLIGSHWSSVITLEGSGETQLHWRLVDGAPCRIAGSERAWTVHLEPLAEWNGKIPGFVLYLTASAPLPQDETEDEDGAYAPSLGRDLTPVLRQPINRIIANAETIRAKLAGPLDDGYSTYAQDIANAGEHLLGLMDDLSDLEVVESHGFTTAPDRIDLADVARRACGILGVRAQEKRITLVPPADGEAQIAIAEFRRVLQILLNLIGNAIRYAPEDSQVWVRLDGIGNRAMVTVADQGHGLDVDQQDKVFEKFERLGRSGDNGSGLGLYISRKIARAMDGDLTVESAPGQGARFTLSVPAAPQ